MASTKTAEKLRKHIGRRLAGAIWASGIPEHEVAERCGLSSSSLSSWATGRTQPTLDQFATLCKMLRVTPNTMLGWEARAPGSPPSIEALRSAVMQNLTTELALEPRATRGSAEPRRRRSGLGVHAARLERVVTEMERKYLPHLAALDEK
jgi:transcriptional regulator with XRE-family HTH domain